MRMIRASLLAAGAASAFVASAAYAEDAHAAASAATQPADAAAAQPAADQPAPAAPATTAAEEPPITVTARRTAERLTSVPVSVAIVSGDSLASRGVSRVDDLAMTVPSLATRPT